MSGAAAGRVFTWPIRVYWEDTDAGGIVFYANYLKFFERARTEWLRSLGVDQSTLRDTVGGMFVVSETSVRYLAPARLDDELSVTAALEAGGRASLIIAQQARRGDTLLCEGTIRIGWVDAATLRPARIPPSILDVLQNH
jgi:acyl-CoA thioester hydrolase